MQRIRTRSGLCRKEYYFGTPKIAKTRISNVISNTFQNHNLIRRNISPFGEDTRQGEYAKHKFKKIRRLISATAECCEPDSSSTSHFERPRIQQNFIRRLIEVVTTGEQAKIIDCCFCEVMETKQGVSGESNTCARDDYATRRARVLKICRSSGR